MEHKILDEMSIYDTFSMKQCHIAQMIAESNRLVFHVLLFQIILTLISGTTIDKVFNQDLFSIILATAIAIMLYHLLIRKFVEPKLEKMKLICIDNPEVIESKIN